MLDEITFDKNQEESRTLDETCVHENRLDPTVNPC